MIWDTTDEGYVLAYRDAEHWHPLDAGTVACTLCYRQCQIAPGEAGWCKIRRNEGGMLTIPYHGQLAQCQPINLGYRGGIQVWRPGLRAIGVGGLSCTAGCAFCSAGPIALHADRVPWLSDKRWNLIHAGGNYATKAIGHPESVIAYAQHCNAQAIVFAANEPLLTFEYTFDLARLAKAHGLAVAIYTNGFSSVEAIHQIAPFVDCVDIGIKGSLDPAFYARWMRAPGAVEAVKASIAAWQAAGCFLVISDLIAAPHLQTDEAWEQSSAALWAWIVETYGEHTPFFQGPMAAFPWTGLPAGFFQPRTAGSAGERAYTERLKAAYTGAQAAGLAYTHMLQYRHPIRCAACRGVLVQYHEPTHMHHCTAHQPQGCSCWQHTCHVTPDRRCQHCGTAVPIVP